MEVARRAPRGRPRLIQHPQCFVQRFGEIHQLCFQGTTRRRIIGEAGCRERLEGLVEGFGEGAGVKRGDDVVRDRCLRRAASRVDERREKALLFDRPTTSAVPLPAPRTECPQRPRELRKRAAPREEVVAQIAGRALGDNLDQRAVDEGDDDVVSLHGDSVDRREWDADGALFGVHGKHDDERVVLEYDRAAAQLGAADASRLDWNGLPPAVGHSEI
jgi:hypothetical protein